MAGQQGKKRAIAYLVDFTSDTHVYAWVIPRRSLCMDRCFPLTRRCLTASWTSTTGVNSQAISMSAVFLSLDRRDDEGYSVSAWQPEIARLCSMLAPA